LLHTKYYFDSVEPSSSENLVDRVVRFMAVKFSDCSSKKGLDQIKFETGRKYAEGGTR
jgi:hypothetical protein